METLHIKVINKLMPELVHTSDHELRETIFRLEDGGSVFLRNFGIYPQVHTLQPIRPRRHFHRLENPMSHTSVHLVVFRQIDTRDNNYS
jgi:hypothetical protein